MTLDVNEADALMVGPLPSVGDNRAPRAASRIGRLRNDRDGSDAMVLVLGGKRFPGSVLLTNPVSWTDFQEIPGSVAQATYGVILWNLWCGVIMAEDRPCWCGVILNLAGGVAPHTVKVRQNDWRGSVTAPVAASAVARDYVW